jgi:hypothetical protein
MSIAAFTVTPPMATVGEWGLWGYRSAHANGSGLLGPGVGVEEFTRIPQEFYWNFRRWGMEFQKDCMHF